MPRTIICDACGRADVLGGDVIEARLVGGLVLAPRCRDRAACLRRRLAPSDAYTTAHRAVVAARKARLS